MKHIFWRNWDIQYYLDWRGRQAWVQLQQGCLPNLAVGAIQFLKGWIDEEDDVLEFGAGRSTLWFAEHARHVTSIETSMLWKARIEADLAKRLGAVETRKVDILLIAHEKFRYNDHLLTLTVDDTRLYSVVLIDGPHRELSAYYGIRKMISFGLLVWDDWNQESKTVRETFASQHGLKEIVFDDGTHQTACFIRR